MLTQTSIENLKRTVYRHIYAGWLKGRRINSVSMEAALLFLHLNLAADGHGNFHADPELVVVEAFPLRRSVTPDQCQRWIDELAHKGLVSLYEAGGETYGHIVGFTEIQPAGKNGRRHQMHPVNPGESGGIQNDPVNPSAQNENKNENENEKENKKQNETETARAPLSLLNPDPRAERRLPVRLPGISDFCSLTASDSDSPTDGTATQEPSREPPQNLTRDKAKARWLTVVVQHDIIGRVNGSKHPKGSPQHAADLTSLNRLWDRVWPEAIEDVEHADPEQVARFNALIAITRSCAGKRKPMAWLTQQIKKQIDEVPTSA